MSTYEVPVPKPRPRPRARPPTSEEACSNPTEESPFPSSQPAENTEDVLISGESNREPPTDNTQQQQQQAEADEEDEQISDHEEEEEEDDEFESGNAPPPLPSRDGRKPLGPEKPKRIRTRRRPNNLKEKPTRPPPPAPEASSIPKRSESQSQSDSDKVEEDMYENVEDNEQQTADQRMSSVTSDMTQGEYAQPVDPIAAQQARRPPPPINDDVMYDDTEDHQQEEIIYDDGTEMESIAQQQQNASLEMTNVEEDTAPVDAPAPPAPYRTETDDASPSESPISPTSPTPAGAVGKKKRSWANVFSRRPKQAADSVPDEEYLNRTNYKTPPIGIATSSINVAKPKPNFLSLVTGEKLDILEMTQCPRGTWICKNSHGMVGFVLTKDVALNPDSIRDYLDAIPKPQRAEVSAEGLPLETLSTTAGINVLPTEECQIKAKQASAATQRLMGMSSKEDDDDDNEDGNGDEEQSSDKDNNINTNTNHDNDEDSATPAADNGSQRLSTSLQKEAAAPDMELVDYENDGGMHHDDTYAVPDELMGEPSGLVYDDTATPAQPDQDDMYEAVDDAMKASMTPVPPQRPDRPKPKRDPTYEQADTYNDDVDTPAETERRATTTSMTGETSTPQSLQSLPEVAEQNGEEEDTYACMDDANLPSDFMDTEDVYLSMQPREKEIVYENSPREEKPAAYENVSLRFKASNEPQVEAPALPPRKASSDA
eukprot:m.13443 g.13443  ORF g.13443 m.13443 type:complete len:714 (-) comp7270_c1_seq1:142-2283(-)